jgi:hypothetical protein
MANTENVRGNRLLIPLISGETGAFKRGDWIMLGWIAWFRVGDGSDALVWLVIPVSRSGEVRGES